VRLPLKDLDAKGHLRFLFITGVSKFSKVSLFSDLNNLMDLSKVPLALDLLGMTQIELEANFEERIDIGIQQFKTNRTEFLKVVKDWYNGYSYDGEITLYNPFSILTFFTHFRFDNYWFETGTPTFLVETIRKQYINPRELEHVEIDNYFFNSFPLEELDIVGLLYQTGYLTIKKATYGFAGSKYVLGYPNCHSRAEGIIIISGDDVCFVVFGSPIIEFYPDFHIGHCNEDDLSKFTPIARRSINTKIYNTYYIDN
jgi:hypothetical protein